MSAKRNRPHPKVEAAQVKQELAGSENHSTEKYTPWGMSSASTNSQAIEWAVI